MRACVRTPRNRGRHCPRGQGHGNFLQHSFYLVVSTHASTQAHPSACTCTQALTYCNLLDVCCLQHLYDVWLAPTRPIAQPQLVQNVLMAYIVMSDRPTPAGPKCAYGIYSYVRSPNPSWSKMYLWHISDVRSSHPSWSKMYLWHISYVRSSHHSWSKMYLWHI